MGPNLRKALEDFKYRGFVVGVRQILDVTNLIEAYQKNTTIPTPKLTEDLAVGISALLASSQEEYKQLYNVILTALIDDHKEKQNPTKRLHTTPNSITSTQSAQVTFPTITPIKNRSMTYGRSLGADVSIFIILAFVVYLIPLPTTQNPAIQIYGVGLVYNKMTLPNKDNIEKLILARCPDRPDFKALGMYEVPIIGQNTTTDIDFWPALILSLCCLFLVLVFGLWSWRKYTIKRPKPQKFENTKPYFPIKQPQITQLLTTTEQSLFARHIPKTISSINSTNIDIKKSVDNAIKNPHFAEPIYIPLSFEKDIWIASYAASNANMLIRAFSHELLYWLNHYRIHVTSESFNSLEEVLVNAKLQQKESTIHLFVGGIEALIYSGGLKPNIEEVFVELKKLNIVFIDVSRSAEIEKLCTKHHIIYLYPESVTLWLSTQQVHNKNPSKHLINNWSSILPHLPWGEFYSQNLWATWQNFTDWLTSQRGEPLAQEHILYGFRSLYAPLIDTQAKPQKNILLLKELIQDVHHWKLHQITQTKPEEKEVTAHLNYDFEVFRLRWSQAIQDGFVSYQHFQEFKKWALQPGYENATLSLSPQTSSPLTNQQNQQLNALQKQSHSLNWPKTLSAAWALLLGLFLSSSITTYRALTDIPPAASPLEMIILPGGTFCMGSHKDETEQKRRRNFTSCECVFFCHSQYRNNLWAVQSMAGHNG